jgi:hypothetical protein
MSANQHEMATAAPGNNTGRKKLRREAMRKSDIHDRMHVQCHPGAPRTREEQQENGRGVGHGMAFRRSV